MNLNKIVSYLLLVILCFALDAADISAPKMEIVDSDKGRLTIFPQGIIITNKDTKIAGKNAIFYERENRAEIYDSVNIINPQYTITADTIFYSFTEKKSTLKGNVIVESETLRIETSTLMFEQSANLVTVTKPIKIIEKLQKLTVYGNNGSYNFTDNIGQVDAQPVLHIERQDTTIIRSQKMTLNNKDARFIAQESVIANTNNSTLRCDTLIFYTKENFGIAQGAPVLYNNDNRLSGQLIKFYFTDNTDNNKSNLDYIQVLDKANAVYITNDGGQLEVRGDQFTITYQDKEVVNIKITSDSLTQVIGKFIPKQNL